MLAEPNCSKRRCKYFEGVKYLEEDNEESEVPYCLAFPEGIPAEIAYGKDKHSEVRASQKGDYIFEKE